MRGSDPMLFSLPDLRKFYDEHYTCFREDDVFEAARALSTRLRQEVVQQANYLWSLFLHLYDDTVAEVMNKDTWIKLVSKKLT